VAGCQTTVHLFYNRCCVSVDSLQGGCIFAGEAASLTVIDCNFTDNGFLPGTNDTKFVANGGALAVDGTRTSSSYPVNLVVRRSNFIGNTAEAGGAINAVQYASARGRVEVHDCLFSGNTVSSGCALLAKSCSARC
jgi:predicted outer membrane repeat protein